MRHSYNGPLLEYMDDFQKTSVLQKDIAYLKDLSTRVLMGRLQGRDGIVLLATAHRLEYFVKKMQNNNNNNNKRWEEK